MKDPRYNIYTLIHKGLRASLCQQLVELGRLDDTDTDSVTQQLNACEHLLQFCLDHLAHENQFIHAAINDLHKIPLQTEIDHVQHEREIATLRQDIALIKKLPSLRRRQALLEFYADFSLFVADNFMHMNQEETYNAELLWEHFSDAQIHDIHQRLVASLTPEENLQSLMMMLPNITHSERVEVLSSVAKAAPEGAVAMLVTMLKPLINEREWKKLNQTLVDERLPAEAAIL